MRILVNNLRLLISLDSPSLLLRRQVAIVVICGEQTRTIPLRQFQARFGDKLSGISSIKDFKAM